MLKINGKTFMNIQEAVKWLLDNNSLPFQCTANYVANTEIGLGTIVNPTPAKVRIGSLIFFADSKVSTVVGLTENGFIVSDQYNNLVDDIAYVTNVAIDPSGHLITTLSDGQTIDAGIVKQVSGFSIDASQHLIVTYNDGSTTDLGAIFQGNVNIAGNLTADSIIENMSGYGFTKGATTNITYEFNYVGVVKNGNKLTFAIACSLTRTDDVVGNSFTLGKFSIPLAIANMLYPQIGGTVLAGTETYFYASYNSGLSLPTSFIKYSNVDLPVNIYNCHNMTLNQKYYIRWEQTFLLSENLVS